MTNPYFKTLSTLNCGQAYFIGAPIGDCFCPDCGKMVKLNGPKSGDYFYGQCNNCGRHVEAEIKLDSDGRAGKWKIKNQREAAKVIRKPNPALKNDVKCNYCESKATLVIQGTQNCGLCGNQINLCDRCAKLLICSALAHWKGEEKTDDKKICPLAWAGLLAAEKYTDTPEDVTKCLKERCQLWRDYDHPDPSHFSIEDCALVVIAKRMK